MTDKIIINEVSLNPLKWFKSKENSDDSVKVNKFQLSDLRNEFIAPDKRRFAFNKYIIWFSVLI